METINLIFNGLFLLAILGFLVYAFGGLLKDIYLGNNCKNWPSTEGKVIHSSTKQKSRKGVKSHFAKIQYTYEVDGQHYEGKRISYGAIWGMKGIAQGHRRRYRKGKKVPVYYHPRRPSLATLETGLPFETYIAFLILSALFFGFIAKIFGVA